MRFVKTTESKHCGKWFVFKLADTEATTEVRIRFSYRDHRSTSCSL